MRTSCGGRSSRITRALRRRPLHCSPWRGAHWHEPNRHRKQESCWKRLFWSTRAARSCRRPAASSSGLVASDRYKRRKEAGYMRRTLLATLVVLSAASPVRAQHLLVPMDRAQNDHLKAYGLTYWVLDQRLTAEWLLNYRSGSFLLPDRPEVRREAS